jgi:hypothetical protein
LVNLDNKNSTYKIYLPENFSSYHIQYLGYNNGVFFIGNEDRLSCFTLLDELDAGEVCEVNIEESEIHEVEIGLLKIKSIQQNLAGKKNTNGSQVIVALETTDNQIDFNVLRIEGQGANFSFAFQQCSDVVPRDVKLDPVVDLHSIWDDKETHFAITLRKSGAFDIYWNYTLIDSSIEGRADRVDLSFDTAYYMKCTHVWGVSLSYGNRVSHANAEVHDHTDPHTIFYQRMKNNCKIFNSFTLIRNTFFVAHGRIISIFNALK